LQRVFFIVLKNNPSAMNLKRIFRHFLVVLLLLLIPLMAMQITDQVNWSLIDFLVMMTLLMSVFLGVDMIWQKVPNKSKRFGLIAIFLLIFFMIWVELAVGILD
jgi:hypothetical protein